MASRMSPCLRLVLVVTVLAELGVLQVEADYDNHWTFYFETPCCGHHHLRHHKGEKYFNPTFNEVPQILSENVFSACNVFKCLCKKPYYHLLQVRKLGQ
jgi:hypothetical protein